MRISATGQDHYHDGRKVGRYARSPELGPVLVWYHCGLHKYDHHAWAMETDVEFNISVSVDDIIVVQQPDGAWLVGRDEFTASTEDIDGDEQYVAHETDEWVTPIEEPASVLRGDLYIESGNQVDEGYHVKRNEA